jgi:hypothetical protein
VYKTVRRHQTRAAGDQLFIRRKCVDVDADVARRPAVSRSVERRAVSASVDDIDYRTTLGEVGRISNLEWSVQGHLAINGSDSEYSEQKHVFNFHGILSPASLYMIWQLSNSPQIA